MTERGSNRNNFADTRRPIDASQVSGWKLHASSRPGLSAIGIACCSLVSSLEIVMARKKKLDFSDIATDRKKTGINQRDFWARYGVTQSGGSRYESGPQHSEASGHLAMAASLGESD
jgi:DNA-binding transcriptional regulator YiaG